MKTVYSLLCFTVLITLFTGCKKDYDKSVFEKLPQERIEDMLTDYKNVLTSTPYGWVGYIYPAVGGYASTFLFQFDSVNRVTQYCDISDQTISTPSKSSYRIQALQMPTLVFDTYSYIHLLADPNSSVMGGSSGQGFQSDFEFYFEKIAPTKDTIWMSGARYGTSLVLTKVTDDNRADVEQGFTQKNGEVISNIKYGVESYLSAAKFTNLKMPDGKQLTMVSAGGSGMYIYYEGDNDSLVASSNLYSFTAKGIHFQDTVKYRKNLTFQDLEWNLGSNNSFYLNVDTMSTNAGVPGNALPDFPLYQVFGMGLTGFYVQSPFVDNTDAAIPQSFRDLYKSLGDTLYKNYSYALRYIDFKFNSYYKVFQVHFSVQRGSTVDNANFTYTFKIIPGTGGGKDAFQFINHTDDAGGTVIRPAVQPLLDYFETGSKSVIIDYYQSATVNMLGKMTSVDNPGFYFTGSLF